MAQRALGTVSKTRVTRRSCADLSGHLPECYVTVSRAYARILTGDKFGLMILPDADRGGDREAAEAARRARALTARLVQRPFRNRKWGEMNYECDRRFDSYYLEDSYVLGLDESEPLRLAFSLLLVLTPQHPLYSKPLPMEQHCYRNGTLVFEGVSSLRWTERSFKPLWDASGTVDYGNIDVFKIKPQGQYYLEGDWGSVRITARRAAITLS